MIEAERIRGVAEEVLGDPAYADLRQSPLTRLVAEVRSWIAEQLFSLFSGSAAANIGLVVALVVVLVAVALGVVTLLGARRSAAADLVVGGTPGATAAEVEAGADAARAAGDVVAAVRQRYGLLVLVLAERDVVPRLPGLTVGEVDAAVVGSAPACAQAVVDAGDALADIVYGHRPATLADDDLVADAVALVRRTVPQRAVAA